MPILMFFLAQTATEKSGAEIWLNFLIAWGPVVLVAGIIYWVIRKGTSTARPLRERSVQHMDRIEAQSERMSKLLEEIRDQRRGPGT